jgi:NAD(P)-dependent dehydrogenase (short-subunit alcohol dehydrogenase family)
MSRFEDQVAIVTGGACGIGGATARKLAKEGAKVFIADFNEEAATKNVKLIQNQGGTAAFSHIDVSKSEDVERMVKETVQQFGGVDILVQNAFSVVSGENHIHGSAVTVKEESWDYGMDVMLKALYLGVKHCIPHMQRNQRGNIVNIASVHSFLQEPNMLVYETAKAAVVGLTRQMAVDFGPENIRVNAIAPGHIVTEGIQKVWNLNPTGLQFFENQYPLRKTGIPNDIAEGIAFLCSDQASFITGHTLVIDGGLSIQLQEKFGIRQGVFARNHPEVQIPNAAYYEVNQK